MTGTREAQRFLPVHGGSDCKVLQNHLEIIQDIEGIRQLADEWDAALSDSQANTVFLTSDWIVSWWEGYRPVGKIRTLVQRDNLGSVIGIAPLYTTKKKLYGKIPYKALMFLGDGTYESEYLDFFTVSGWESETVSRFLDWLQDNTILWDLCELNIIPANSKSLPIVKSWARQHNYLISVEEYDYCQIPLPSNWNAYLSSLNRSHRQNVRYYSRRAEKLYNAEFHQASSYVEVLSSLEDLFRLHQMRWDEIGEKGSFSFPGRRRFYQAMSRRFLERDWLRLYTLRLKGKPAAVQFGFVYNRIFHALQEGFDPGFAKESPGVVLRAKTIEKLISNGVYSYDFLGQPTEFKTRWRTESNIQCVSLKIAKRSFHAQAIFRLPILSAMLRRSMKGSSHS